MKRFIIYIITGLFLFSLSGNVSAVEKKVKKTTSKNVVKKKAKGVKSKKLKSKKLKSKKLNKSSKKIKSKKKKKYDNFIDKNNNGIDDRQEKLRVKTSKKAKKKK